jgi:hypothetical protein
MTDEQIVAYVAEYSNPGVTAKEFGQAHGMTTAVARKRLEAVASATGLIYNTGFVRVIRGGFLDVEEASDIKKVPGGSLIYQASEFRED